MRWLIGEIRNHQRPIPATQGVLILVHAVALKQVDTTERIPFKCISTKVLGVENVINAALDCGVQRVIGLSTDRASSPVNLYGASKVYSDKLLAVGNRYLGTSSTRFAVVRYGLVS